MGNRNSRKKTTDVNDHVGIIGAGPAGIAAAWFLMEKGYRNITILEAEDQVGGKCRTVTYTDSKGVTNNYELGAEYITYAYDLIFEFMKAVGEKWTTAGTILTILGNGKFVDAAKSQSIFKVLPALFRYMRILRKYKKTIANPSNAGVAADPFLSQSSQDFITENKLEALEPLFLVKQFGYGSFDQFPAIDLMRTLPISTMTRTIIEQIPILHYFWRRPIASLADNGTQSLFKKMADKIDAKKAEKMKGAKAVLLGQKVESIEKKDPGQESSQLFVKTNKESHVFDKVICAVPPNIVKDLVEFLPDEMKDLMKAFKYDPYFVSCIDPDYNLKTAYYQNQKLEPGDPVQFSKRWSNSPIVAYGYNWVEGSDFQPGNEVGGAVLEERLEAYLKANMKITSHTNLPGAKVWDNYHPHVPIKDFQAGLFDKLESFQGFGGIYLAGDGMSMESMECSCQYSKQLVGQYF